MIHALLVVSRAGGLVFSRSGGAGVAALSANERLVLAGTLHGVHALAAQVSPVPSSSGLVLVESESLRIYIFQAPTGVKIVLITDAAHPAHEAACRRFYEIYADYALKNPFYTPEMPIRAELFDLHIQKAISLINNTI